MPAVFLSLILLLAPGQAPASDAKDVRTIYLALLSKGAAWTSVAAPELQRLQQAHVDYLSKLAMTGQIVANGPIGDEGDLRGVVLFTAVGLDEARQLMSDDPAVKATRLAADVIALSVSSQLFVVDAGKDDTPVRQFVIGLLNAQPGAGEDSGPDAGRAAYLLRLRDSGLLVFAADATDRRRRGLLVFASDNAAAVKALAADDPAVKAGRVAIEWHTWFAPDGVMRIAKTGS